MGGELTDCMKAPDSVKDENFLHLVWNSSLKAFNELIDFDDIFREHIEHRQSSDFRKASVTEVDHGIGGSVTGSDLKASNVG